MTEFTLMHTDESTNAYLKKKWIEGKSKEQLISDLNRLEHERKFHASITSTFPGYNGISRRNFSVDMLSVIDFWIDELKNVKINRTKTACMG